MPKIFLFSDTHGHWDSRFEKHLLSCDEMWHAGDIGEDYFFENLPFKGTKRIVHGNIDGTISRKKYPEVQTFTLDGVKVLMIHIGGNPGKYPSRIRQLLIQEKPKLFICGHSHILKVMYDHSFQHLHINPGAAGIYGIHKVKTALRFEMEAGEIKNMEIIELSKIVPSHE